MKDLIKEIKRYDKQMDILDQLGARIVHDPNMRDLDKTLVTNEKGSITGRWQELLSNTEATRNRYEYCLLQWLSMESQIYLSRRVKAIKKINFLTLKFVRVARN